MANQNVELNLMALERLKQELESLVKDIENRQNSYVASVRALMQTDLDVNITDQYKNNYWQHNNALMAQLKQRIETQDIPYIDRCIMGAKQALASYQG